MRFRGVIPDLDATVLGRRACLAAPLVLALLLPGPSVVGAESWGSRPYVQEKPEYLALVKQLELEASQLLSRIRQVESDIEASLGRCSAGERQKLVQEYERSQDNHNHRKIHFRAQQEQQQAKELYDDARVAISPGQEKQAEVRAGLWSRNVEWRRRRVETRRAQLAWLDSKLIEVLRRDAREQRASLGTRHADSSRQLGAGRGEKILVRLRSLVDATRGRVGQAESECAVAGCSLTNVESELAALAGQLSGLESQMAEATQAPSGDILSRVQARAREAEAAAGRAIEAKQRVEASAARACVAADELATVASGAEQAQWLATAAAAAGEASVYGQLAADHAAQALRAAQAVTALARGGRSPTAVVPLPGLEEVESSLASAEQALARAEQAGRQVHTILAGLARARAESNALYDEARRILEPGHDQPGRGRDLAEVQGLFAQMMDLGSSLDACAADLAQLDGQRSQLPGLRLRLEALRGDGPAQGRQLATAELLEIEVRARASAATAEVCAEGAQAISGRAQVCRDRAQAVGPLPLLPQGPDPDAWVEGSVRDLDPRAPLPRPGVDVSSFIAAATAAAGDCRYPEALHAADQAAARAPDHPWLAANHQKLRGLADRQRQAAAAMNRANSALQAKDYATAGQEAELLQRTAPRCMDDLVAGFLGVVNEAAGRNVARWRPRNDPKREAIGEMPSTLPDTMTTTIAGQAAFARSSLAVHWVVVRPAEVNRGEQVELIASFSVDGTSGPATVTEHRELKKGGVSIKQMRDALRRSAGSHSSAKLVRVPATAAPGIYAFEVRLTTAGAEASGKALFEVR